MHFVFAPAPNRSARTRSPVPAVVHGPGRRVRARGAQRHRATAPRGERDRASIVAGIRIALEIAARSAVADRVTGPFDGPASYPDADLLTWASTCAIGAVVGPEPRVYDVPGLRVVDASVFPTAPRGNTDAPTIMAAEKAADLVEGAA
ncbi:GMC oxidoreductase [Streptomyces solaniscabiei]|uniref:GMC oxidoreductase n=1 Tax=Streptomyces solaniscabiei TaxID=2683255 RepID=UPI001CE2F7D7|nr:GMC oxidoreductase [Streptomyces solaniscabiei]